MRVLRERRSGLAALALAAVAVLACSDSTGPTGPVPAQIVVSTPSLSILQKDSTQIVPSVLDKDGALITGVVVKFRSADTTIAKVSAIGEVSSVGPAGQTTVTVTAGRVHTDVPVTIVAVSGSIAVTPNPAIVPQKGTLQVSAKVLDLAGSQVPGAQVSFASSDESIAHVDASTGLITSAGPAGAALLIVTCDTLSTLVPISVPQMPTSISVPSTVTMALNSTQQLAPRVLDAVGTAINGAPVTYTSDNTAVVNVAGDGTLHAFNTIGAANVTVRSGTLSKVVRVNVVVAAHPAGVLDATTPVSGNPWGVAVSRSGVVYVGTLGGTVVRGDLPSYALTTVVTGSAVAAGIVFNSTGTTAYVAGGPSFGVAAIDVSNNNVLWDVQLSGTPYTVALSRDEQTVYVTTSAGQVFAVDVATRTIKATIPVGGGPNHIAMAPDGLHLYVNDFTGGVVYEIDTRTNAVSRVFTVGVTPQGVSVAVTNSELYVASEGAARVDVVDLGTGAIVGQVSLNGGAFGLAISPDGTQLYAAEIGTGSVAVIDRASRTVVNRIALNGAPRYIAFNAAGTIAVVTLDSGGVAFIR